MNKDVVLELIRMAPEGVSRAAIAQLLGVSRSSISVIVDDLIQAGLVLEHGVGASRGGRRPIVLQINPDAGRVLGIAIGATHALVILSDLRGGILAEASAALDIAQPPQTYLDRVYALADHCLARTESTPSCLSAIGVGVPGPVILDRGHVAAPPIMPGWDSFAISQALKARWNTEIVLDNDANLGALGEYTYGGGRGERNLVYVKIGTGIGCGILLDGMIYHGVLGTAGEIGHVTINEDGPPCSCGNYGCLEAMAGGCAIAQRAEMAIRAGQQTSLTALCHERALSVHDVVEAAHAGDHLCQQLLSDAGRHVGSALASLINLLNPGAILMGGGVTLAGELFLGAVHQSVQERTMRPALRAVRLAPAALGSRASAMGAVALAITQTLQTSTYLCQRRGVRRPALPTDAYRSSDLHPDVVVTVKG